MNKWNRLLAVLDQVYGYVDKKRSEYRKVSQHYDERTNEHVVVIEYRVRRGSQVDREIQTESGLPRDNFSLIREINTLAG